MDYDYDDYQPKLSDADLLLMAELAEETLYYEGLDDEKYD